MLDPLRVLIASEGDDDAQSIVSELRRPGCDVVAELADVTAALAASDGGRWDAIIVATVPGDPRTVELASLAQQRSDAPFVLVSLCPGAGIAVAAPPTADRDPVLTYELAHLTAAVDREIQKTKSRRQREKDAAGLEESLSRWRRMAQTCPDIITVVDRLGRILYINHGVPGYPPPDELIGRPMGPFFSAADRETLERTLSSVFDGGQPCGAEVKSVRLDGSHDWWLFRMWPDHRDVQVASVIILWSEITGYKQAEENLRLSEERFQLVARGAAVGIWEWNIQSNVDYVSDEWCRHLGLEPNELPRNFATFQSLLHPDDEKQVLEGLRRHLGDRVPYRLEHRIRTKSGEFRWFLANGQAVWDDAGRPLRMAGSIVDVTERRLAEDELRRSQERFELAARGAAVGIWEWNVVTNEDYFSDRWCRLLGYEPSELTFRYETWVSHLHPDEIDQVLGAVRRHLEHRVPYDIEYRMRTKSGDYRWFHATGQAVWNEAGAPLRMAGSISDITESKRLQQQFRMVVDSTPNGLVMVNRDGQIVFVNPQTERMFGYPRAELLGQPIETLVPQRFQQQHAAHVLGFIQRPEARAMGTGRDLTGRRRDGSEFPVEIGLNPIEFEGELLVLAGITDITERKFAEDERREASLRTRLLDQVMAAREEEQTRIARDLHDGIGQTLTSLRYGLQAVSTSNTLAEAAARTAELQNIAASLQTDVRDLIRGLRPGVLDDLGLAPALERLADEFFRAHEIVVRVDAAERLPRRLPLRIETALYRIAQEALNNVAKHAAAQRVQILIATRADSVELTVADDGVGYDIADLAHSGGGLGLAGMRERAALLGGDVCVASQPGTGTTVRAVLPMRAAP